MRIAFLSFYSGQIDRGVEVATQALAQGLASKHEVTVFQAGERTIADVETVQLSIEKKWPPDTSNNWLRYVYLDYYSRKILWFTLKFLPYFFRFKYDVVIPTNGGWQMLFVRLATWLTGRKILVQGNAGLGRDDLWQLLCLPDHFVAISPQGFAWASRRFPLLKISYIPYGVDNESFRTAKAVNIPLKKPVVLCVAAFSPYKRIDLLIRAMEQVPQSGLLIIGQGPLENKLRILGLKILGRRFLLKTGVLHHELLSYYKSADVFSLPSSSTEALGIVYLEAMAAGLPIVAPDDQNRREIIGDAGIFVDPENTDAYAKAIKLALTSNFRDKSLKQAEKFTWKNIVGQYLELFKHI